MAGEELFHKVDAAKLERLVTKIYAGLEVPEADALLLGNALVDADLRGKGRGLPVNRDRTGNLVKGPPGRQWLGHFAQRLGDSGAQAERAARSEQPAGQRPAQQLAA